MKIDTEMAKLNAPDGMDFSKPQMWPDWKKRFNRYRIASKLCKESGEIQVSTLVYAMGQESEHIFSQFALSEADQKDYDKVIAQYDKHFIPKTNVIHERAMFHQRCQKQGENAETYIRTLYEMAENCDFKDTKEDCIRDRLVVGIQDKALSQELQMKSSLKLNEALELIRQSETVRGQVSAQHDNPKAIEEVRKHRSSNHGNRKPGQKPRGQWTPSYNDKHGKGSNDRTQYSDQTCGKCGRRHGKNCPARFAKCNVCHRTGHYGKCCRAKSVREIEDCDTYQEYFESPVHFLGTVSRINENHKSWSVELPIKEHMVTFKIDSGADVSVMSRNTYQKLQNPPRLQPTSHILRGVSGILKCRGVFTAHTRYRSRNYSFDIYVVDTSNNLLSRNMAQAMDLIKLNINEIQNETDAVQEMGTLKGDPVQIHLKENAVPFHVHTARRIPVPLIPKVTKELERMEKAGVIRKITEPTEWCSPIVVVPKKDKEEVRLCVDLRQLNKNIKRERYILPTLDDITSLLNGATVFTSLDAASGYYQMKLHPDSSKLTTFIAPSGRYCFRRVPFGISLASEIFQRKMASMFEGLEGVAVFQDDILIFGRTMEQHDFRLKKVMSIISESGLKLNLKKCHWRQSQLDFVGHRFSKEGIKPDPNKIKAICEMEAPRNVTELRRICGMVNYLSMYVSDLATIMKPLNELLKKDMAWTWGPSQEYSFEQIKNSFSQATALAYYDSRKPTIVSADASSYGLGAVLLQKCGDQEKPVAFASRTLSATETQYAQIEKECLASVWACEKFDRYLRGLESFRLLTDHKPLVPLINGKDINAAPMRCQRLLMRLMKYTPVAEYVPGKHMIIADTLSRHPVNTMNVNDVQLEQEVEVYVIEMMDSWPMSDSRLEEIKEATRTDHVLQDAIKFTIEGWPKYKEDVSEHLHELYTVKSHLTVADHMLIYDGKIVIPIKLREKILDIIHHGHQGISKCRERANTAVWWYGIGASIKNMVQKCEHCQVQRSAQHREPLKTTTLPNGPWVRIGVDLFYFKGDTYLVAIDYYSRYLELVYLSESTSQGVVSKLKCMFARWGIPKEMVSDNGPQFASERFSTFAREYGFSHITSSPHYPQSNGAAERAVQIAKQILKQEDPFLALMVYRATPIKATGYSPSEIMLNRQIQTTLPVLQKNIEIKGYDEDRVKRNDEQYKRNSEYYYNRRYSAKPLSEMTPGTRVRVKTEQDKTWSEPMTVTDKLEEPRSYKVQKDNGSSLRRNRKHIMVIPEEQNNVVCAKSPQATASASGDYGTNSGEQTQTVSSNIPEQRSRYGRIIKAPDRLNI